MKLFICFIVLITSFIIVIRYFDLNKSKNKSITDAVEIFNYNNPIFESNLTKYYKSTEFDMRVEETIKILIPNHADYKLAKQLLNAFCNEGDVFIFGGVIRDIINGEVPKDIDLKIKNNENEKIRIKCATFGIDFNSLLRFDHKNTDSFKKIKFFNGIFDITKIDQVKNENFENDVNSMQYDFKHKILIDPTGTGLINCINKRFQIVQPTFDIWFNSVWENKPKHGLSVRIFKMFKKGYTLVNDGEKTMDNYRIWFKSRLNQLKYKNQYFEIPVLITEFLSICRGDKIDPKTLKIIKRGGNNKNLKELLNQIKCFDVSIFYDIVLYLSKIDPSIIQIIN
jgi:hypothetical protein